MIACRTGTYGKNCNDTCGHCLNPGECYHVNGTCVEGCEAGYQGNLCETSPYSIFSLSLKRFRDFLQTLVNVNHKEKSAAMAL